MLRSARRRLPLLLSSILGGIALCLFMYSLKTPAAVASAASRTRRLDGETAGGVVVPPRETAAAAPSTALAAAEGATSAEVTAPAASSSGGGGGGGDGDGCWIFMHLQKCGGSTVKKMLLDRWGSRYFVYDSMRWKLGDDFSRDFAEKLASGEPWSVMAGGYPEALRRSPAVEAGCRFFTVFRHPIARMVSAYFYCQVLEGDVACASNIVRARDVDLLTFAKHWSNFAVRQFALSMVPADDVMAYVRTPEARALLPESVESVDNVAGWYLLKMYLERPEAEDRRGESGHQQPQWEETAITTREGEDEGGAGEVPDAQMYDFLEPAKALLSDHYAAVGILESWNTTLSLFDKALGMPEMDWQRHFQEEGRQNVDFSFQQLRAETLEKAWTDAELKKYMRLDLLLYEHALAVFDRQARSHGLLV